MPAIRTTDTPIVHVRVDGQRVALYAYAAALGWTVYSTSETLAVGHRSLGAALKAARQRLVASAAPYCCGCECGGVLPCQGCACDGPVQS